VVARFDHAKRRPDHVAAVVDARIRAMAPGEANAFEYHWRYRARPEQLPPAGSRRVLPCPSFNSGIVLKTGTTKSTFLELSGQGPEASPQRGARTAMGALLQLIGEGSDQQIATEAQRWPGAMQIARGKPQIVVVSGTSFFAGVSMSGGAESLCRPRSIVAGKDKNGHGYVLADISGRYPPTEWARLAITARDAPGRTASWPRSATAATWRSAADFRDLTPEL
jgi:hypothetical protein